MSFAQRFASPREDVQGRFVVNTILASIGKKPSDKAPKDCIPTYVTKEKALSIIREIGKSITDENIYHKKQVVEVFNLQPSEAFFYTMLIHFYINLNVKRTAIYS